jgi:hypothetical protein
MRGIRAFVALVGIAVLAGACATTPGTPGTPGGPGTRREGLPPGPPVWVPDGSPFGGVFIDPFSGYPIRGGGG